MCICLPVVCPVCLFFFTFSYKSIHFNPTTLIELLHVNKTSHTNEALFYLCTLQINISSAPVLHVSWQVMWVCNLCRKQQEILTKSGEWFSSGPKGRPLSVAGPEADRDGKLRSRSQATARANHISANDAQPATDRNKGADIMPASRTRSEPPREKYTS